MVACTWIITFSIMIPTWLNRWGKFGMDYSIGSCSILPDDNGHSPKESLFVVAFVVPCLCITLCYARILCLVRQAAFRSREPALKGTSFLSQPSSSSQPYQKSTANIPKTPSTPAIASPKPFEVNADDIEYIDVSDSNDTPSTFNIKMEKTKSNEKVRFLYSVLLFIFVVFFAFFKTDSIPKILTQKIFIVAYYFCRFLFHDETVCKSYSYNLFYMTNLARYTRISCSLVMTKITSRVLICILVLFRLLF